MKWHRQLFLALIAAQAIVAGAADVDFNRDVRPLLSDRCFACHGPAENHRKADLRLDLRTAATQASGHRRAAIIPGDPDSSPLIQRVTNHDEDERMPPDEEKYLTAAEVDVFRNWIRQGASYEKHWAFLPPSGRVTPEDSRTTNPVDGFVRKRLLAKGIAPALRASASEILRRMSLDIIGLPPSLSEQEHFAADWSLLGSEEAVSMLADRLLASPHFGERMAIYWLDLVRYADTRGFSPDEHQPITPYRDYVVDAFNNNVSFDRFTAEQLAGDLLPDATQRTQVGSGYNRLLRTFQTDAGQPAEFFARYAADRVRNVSSVWLGLTMGCAECHDHKYDPLTQQDFYSLAVFFSDVEENATGLLSAEPLPGPRDAIQLASLNKSIPKLEARLKGAPARNYSEWLRIVRAADFKGLPEPIADLLKRPLANRSVEQNLTVRYFYLNRKRFNDATLDTWEDQIRKLGYRGVPEKVRQALKISRAERSGDERTKLQDFYSNWLKNQADYAPDISVQDQIKEEKSARKRILDASRKTLVTKSVMPREVRMLERGNWQVPTGPPLAAMIPAVLGKLSDEAPNRLDLARWLTGPDNPLVARVFVNRVWMLLFGEGIVGTPDDFGRQGEYPSHPELLDWLATDFVDSGWNVKRLFKRIVTSETYLCSSARAANFPIEIDPDNRLLSHQNRFVLMAELIRDNALMVGGLLDERFGGFSALPYQPEGYWIHMNSEFPREIAKEQGSIYRRGLYTYWCRSFLHPSLLAFGAPARDECVVERVRSNTPQQALVLLNDTAYVEAARNFAERVLREAAADTNKRIEFIWRTALARNPKSYEIELARTLFRSHRSQLENDAAAIEHILKVGETKPDLALDRLELAAWTSVTRVVMNLHEFITRP